MVTFIEGHHHYLGFENNQDLLLWGRLCCSGRITRENRWKDQWVMKSFFALKFYKLGRQEENS